MTSTLLILMPTVTPRLREGAQTLLRTDAAKFDSAVENPEAALVVFTRMRKTWALLDAIGWGYDEDAGDLIELDLDVHGESLLTSARIITPLLEGWLDELGENDPLLPERSDEVRIMRQFRLILTKRVATEASKATAAAIAHSRRVQ